MQTYIQLNNLMYYISLFNQDNVFQPMSCNMGKHIQLKTLESGDVDLRACGASQDLHKVSHPLITAHESKPTLDLLLI